MEDINFEGYESDFVFNITEDNDVCSVLRFFYLDVDREARFVSALFNAVTDKFSWDEFANGRHSIKMVTFITSGYQKAANECLDRMIPFGMHCYTSVGGSNTKTKSGYYDIHLWCGPRAAIVNYVNDYAKKHPVIAEIPPKAKDDFKPGSKTRWPF